jgi:hypothetical protein
MALANIRLGAWVPNPRWVADGVSRRDRRKYGRPRPSYLIRELLGRNRIDAKYLYVTDGGHYENLGLVELLRRGCTQIYCFDASGGNSFEQLGDAIALARSEVGVEITIDPDPLVPATHDGLAEANTATGSFRYGPDGPTGTLVYARNVLARDAPQDVMAYHKVDPRFPNDPTADQLYTDQRFESYRRLGARAGSSAIARMEQATVPAVPVTNGHGAREWRLSWFVDENDDSGTPKERRLSLSRWQSS